MSRMLLAGLLLIVTVQAAAPPAVTPAGSTALASFLDAAVASGDVPGTVVLVAGKDRILYHGAFGRLNVARGTALPKDAIFRIASMTKPVTSLGILMLVEEGKVGLDDPVSKYVPSLDAPRVIASIDAAGTMETRPAARPITIRHLLAHTSGIGYAWSDPKLAIAQRTLNRPEPELPLVHDPGARWTYGASTRVLGDVIEKVTGLRVDAFLEARILGPLGMKDTSFAVKPENHARVITLHQKTDGRLTEQQNPEALPVTVRGDGGLYSSALDYARFVRLFLNHGTLDGKRLISERWIREMTRNQIGDLVIEQQPTADPNRSKVYPLGAGADKWGLGFQLAAGNQRTANARSAGSYSWAGINNTHFWVDPQKEIAVIVLMQVLPFYDDAAIRVLQGVEERVYRHLQ